MKIIILAGQSNMAGRGDSAILPYVLFTPQRGIRFHYYCGFAADKSEPLFSKGWKDLAPGEKHKSTQGSHFGPELTLGKKIKDSLLLDNGELGIIKIAIGGSNLMKDWNPMQPEGLKLFPIFKERVFQALQEVSDRGEEIEIIGFFWMQGEADSMWKEYSEKYENSLKEFIIQIRSVLNEPDLPFIQGQIMDRNRKLLPFASTVRTAQKKVTETLPGVYLVNTDDLTNCEDKIHFDGEALIELGKRYAKILLKAVHYHSV